MALRRTPEERFDAVPDDPSEPRYVDVGAPRMASAGFVDRAS